MNLQRITVWELEAAQAASALRCAMCDVRCAVCNGDAFLSDEFDKIDWVACAPLRLDASCCYMLPLTAQGKLPAATPLGCSTACAGNPGGGFCSCDARQKTTAAEALNNRIKSQGSRAAREPVGRTTRELSFPRGRSMQPTADWHRHRPLRAMHAAAHAPATLPPRKSQLPTLPSCSLQSTALLLCASAHPIRAIYAACGALVSCRGGSGGQAITLTLPMQGAVHAACPQIWGQRKAAPSGQACGAASPAAACTLPAKRSLARAAPPRQ